MGAQRTDPPRRNAHRYGRKIQVPGSDLDRRSPPKKPRPKQKGVAMAIALLTLLVIAVMVVSVLAYIHIKPEEYTVEDAFLATIQAINDGDAEELISCSVFCFADDITRQYEISSLKEAWESGGGYSIVVHSYEIKTSEESDYMKQILDEVAASVESKFPVEVDDCRAIYCNFSTYQNGAEHQSYQLFPFVEIDSRWYLAFPDIPEVVVVTPA